MTLINDLLKSTNNEFASIVEDGVIADLTGYINTGAYALNALVSGSIHGGFPRNRITALAGDPSVGKTFAALSSVTTFFGENKNGIVFYFDSESAMTKDMCVARGIDTKRMVILPVATIEQVRKQIYDLLKRYKESKDKTPLMIVLDSLGMLSTTKEMTDVSDGKETRDMTRAQIIKSAFRILTIMAADCNVPILITNHTYSTIGCLEKGTKIFDYKNDLVAIEDVSVADRVMTSTGIGTVTEKFIFTPEEFIKFEFEDGTSVAVTKDHKFLTEKLEWVRAEDLNEEDTIIQMS